MAARAQLSAQNAVREMKIVAGCDGSMDNRRPASQALCSILRVWTERGKLKVGGARAGAFKDNSLAVGPRTRLAGSITKPVV